MKQLLEMMIKYWIYLYCLSGIQSYSYSCPLSDTLFTSAPCCEEQGFYSRGFTGVCFTSTRPNQRSAWVLAEESLCHWCDSHHQRRTSAPCRAVGVCCWAAHPSHPSPMEAASEGMLQQTHGTVAMESCWVCFLCFPTLCCVWWSTSSSPLAQHRELHVSGSLPERILPCCSQGLGPEQSHGTCHRAPPGPAVQLGSAGGQEMEKPCGWVRKVSDYWQSTLIYINNSANLNILCIILISGILSVMCKYLGVRCDFNT